MPKTRTHSENKQDDSTRWMGKKFERLWILCYAESEQTGCKNLSDPFLGQHKIRRPAALLIHPQDGLGLVFRWQIARVLLRQHGVRIEADFRDKHQIPADFWQTGTLEGGSPKRLLRIIEAMQNYEYLKQLCAALQTRLPASFGGKSLTVQEFLSPMPGANAYRDFRTFLLTGELPLPSNGSLLPEITARRDDVKHILERLVHALATPHNGKPVLSLNMLGAPIDMVALAHATLHHFGATRPVLLLPCSRHIPDYHYRGVDFLVQNLSNFFAGKPLTNHPARLTPLEISERLHAIRQDMLKYPAIIIFVGYAPSHGRSANLVRAIRDEPLVELLSHLVHPSLGLPGKPPDIGVFERSRLVVLSDGAMDSLSPFRPQEIKPAPPQGESRRYRDLMTNAGLGDEAGCLAIARDLELTDCRASEAISMAYTQIVLILGNSIGARKYALQRDLVDAPSKLLSTLVLTIEDSCAPIELLLLRLIGVTGAGVRRDTLIRCARMWCAARPQLEGLEIAPHLRIDREDIHERLIDELKTKFACLIVEGADEPLPALDDAGPPLLHVDDGSVLSEHSAHGARHGRAAAINSLDYRYAAVREAILAHLEKEQVWARTLLHEIISKEALRQQILIRRHVMPQQMSSVRAQQRTLEALYHGLLALPPPALWQDMARWPRCSDASLLPPEPVARFQFLYGVLFHEQLEGMEARRLSLNWAADTVKLDILLLIHSAFDDGERSLDKPPIWASDAALFPNMAEYYKDYLAALAVALRNTDDLARWNMLKSALERAPHSRETGQSEFDLVERTRFDLEVAELGPPADKIVSECIDRLDELGIDENAFRLGPWSDENGFIPRTPTAQAFEQHIDEMTRTCLDRPAAQRKTLLSWLVRLAYVRYQAMEFNKVKRWAYSMQAFSILLVARRLMVSSGSGALRTPELSSQSFRVIARAGLEALRLLQTPGGSAAGRHSKERNRSVPNVATQAALEWNDPQRPEVQEMQMRLANEVRQLLNAYALRYSNNMPETVSMLILEARFARTVGALSPSQRIRRHHAAIALLHDAEQRMVNFHARPRLRIRLLIERCATLRGLALDPYATGDSRPERYLKMAESDVRQLEALVSHQFQPLHGRPELHVGQAWQYLVQRQRTLTEQARDRLMLV